MTILLTTMITDPITIKRDNFNDAATCCDRSLWQSQASILQTEHILSIESMNLVLKAACMSSICFGSLIWSAKDISSVENDDNMTSKNDAKSRSKSNSKSKSKSSKWIMIIKVMEIIYNQHLMNMNYQLKFFVVIYVCKSIIERFIFYINFGAQYHVHWFYDPYCIQICNQCQCNW